MNEKTRTALKEANASERLVKAVEMLPKVIVGASFLARNKLRIYEVEVAVYYNERKGKASGAYIYGRINTQPEAVNVFLAEAFSVHLGPQGGVREFILRTFGGAHSFGTTTRRTARMYDHYYRNTNSVNENLEIPEDAVKVKVHKI